MESAHLIQSDITLMRKRYDEALQMQGIPCKYQFPHLPDTNTQGESVIDSYSELYDTHVFFDGNPKVKTFKRYGWVVENDKDLPFLIHCSFSLPHVQKDSIFRIGGQYADIPDRVFRVTEITYDLQSPDHLICQIIPVYEKQIDKVINQSIDIKYSHTEQMDRENGDGSLVAYYPALLGR